MLVNLSGPATIDRELPIPLYSQVRDALLALIQESGLQEGDAIPTESELSRTFEVSRITVRRAIDELVREERLITRQGKGTFVARSKIQRPMMRMQSFSTATAEEGHAPGSRLLALRHEKATPSVALALGVETEQWVWVVERLRLVDGEPIGLSEVYLNLPSTLYLTPAELEQNNSLWWLLEQKGIVLRKSAETIQAVSANEKQAEWLQIEVGSPLLLIEGVVFTEGADPVEYHRMFNRGDRYKYAVELIR
ncbi:MAG: GntR family transcriptional regulator [Anaerolineae bacterium]